MKANGFLLHRRKSTDYKICYKDSLDRIGNIYLPKPFVERMGLGDEIIVQLAQDKNNLQPGGYVTSMVPYKETPKKVRFNEDTREQGALGVIYVSKRILEDMDLPGNIAVRLIGHEEAGGDTLAGA